MASEYMHSLLEFLAPNIIATYLPILCPEFEIQIIMPTLIEYITYYISLKSLQYVATYMYIYYWFK